MHPEAYRHAAGLDRVQLGDACRGDPCVDLDELERNEPRWRRPNYAPDRRTCRRHPAARLSGDAAPGKLRVLHVDDGTTAPCARYARPLPQGAWSRVRAHGCSEPRLAWTGSRSCGCRQPVQHSRRAQVDGSARSRSPTSLGQHPATVPDTLSANIVQFTERKLGGGPADWCFNIANGRSTGNSNVGARTPSRFPDQRPATSELSRAVSLVVGVFASSPVPAVP